MSATTNLKIDYRNTYWVVTAPFDVYCRRRTTESNTYFGASKALGNLYERIEVQPGDEIHALVGGTFLVHYKPGRHGEVEGEVTLGLDEKHPFEKRYFPREDVWPLDKLSRMAEDEHAEVDGYSSKADGAVLTFTELKEMGAVPFERSIDWVLPPRENRP